MNNYHTRSIRRIARNLLLGLVLGAFMAACAGSGGSPNVRYGVGVRHYNGYPWGAYHAADVADTIDAIDTIDTIDAIDSMPPAPMGPPDMGGGMDMDMGFDW